MTTNSSNNESMDCPAEQLLRVLTGKWKPLIFRYASLGPVRFSSLLKDLVGINRQSLSLALKEMESEGFLERKVISEKPLHVEYELSEKGKSVIPVFQKIDKLDM